jgi:hypothetical protein
MEDLTSHPSSPILPSSSHNCESNAAFEKKLKNVYRIRTCLYSYFFIATVLAYAVIPFVSAINAVSRFSSSSRNSVSLNPASIKSVGRSL